MGRQNLWHKKICYYLLLVSLFSLTNCKQENTTKVKTANESKKDVLDAEKNAKLLSSIEILADPKCDLSLDQVKIHWEEKATILGDYSNPNKNEYCHWTKLEFINNFPKDQKRVIYFPKAWEKVDCYIPNLKGEYQLHSLEGLFKPATLSVNIPSADTLTFYVHYPVIGSGFFQKFYVWELSEETYQILLSRTKYKFAFIGFLLFPLLFFLARFLVEFDRLNLAYIFFLFGAALQLVTILEGEPYFELTPNFIIFMDAIFLQGLFLMSILILFTGITKYIHLLLDFSQNFPGWYKAGNILLSVFALIAFTPFIFQKLFLVENYGFYLQFFRFGGLVVILYIFIITTKAALAKIKFSLILLLAFAPFILTTIYYALSFLILQHSSSSNIESIILITGFFLTIILFGLILEFRNNAMKKERLLFEHKAQHLEDLDQFKSRFYTNFTHEFRTPLTVISGMAGQIEGNEKSKELIQRNSKRLLNTVNQLLELSKLESNSLKINWIQGNIVNFLEYLTESCISMADRKSLHLAFFSENEKIFMDYDAMKIQQILINLISNAIRFTPEYGTVKVIAREIKGKNQNKLKLVVSDTGRGIPEDKLSQIFNRFYQVDDTDTRPEEGSGVGLALVKELVNLFDGKVEVESEVGYGTKFMVFLPIHQEAIMEEFEYNHLELGLEKESTTSDDCTSADTIFDSQVEDAEKPIVLVIEDNKDVTEYIISCLSRDFIVHTARNGKFGVLKALEIIPDVIISDVMMPEMDGFEVCEKLKADKRTSHVPIILLTAKATQEDRVDGFKRGADAYLTKPFDKEELLIRLGNLSTLSRQLKDQLNSAKPIEVSTDLLSQLEGKFLEEVNEVIQKNLESEYFDTLHLCREVAMSRTQLHRKLKALTGQSTANYIRSHRMKTAKTLLETTTLPIGEISVQVGFKDFSHFSRSFAQQYGCSPSETRK